jgi:hypothetical protein
MSVRYAAIRVVAAFLAFGAGTAAVVIVALLVRDTVG